MHRRMQRTCRRNDLDTSTSANIPNSPKCHTKTKKKDHQETRSYAFPCQYHDSAARPTGSELPSPTNNHVSSANVVSDASNRGHIQALSSARHKHMHENQAQQKSWTTSPNIKWSLRCHNMQVYRYEARVTIAFPTSGQTHLSRPMATTHTIDSKSHLHD